MALPSIDKADPLRGTNGRQPVLLGLRRARRDGTSTRLREPPSWKIESG